MILKRYSNRKVYNPETKSYINLVDLLSMVRDGREFSVVDHDTQQDITRETLQSAVFGYTQFDLGTLKRMVAK